MGMSASQMRYCMIAGKKNDVEFQGQQINQQRTTLATSSSAYNTQLLTLSVPTPPSTSDYTKTTYTFSLGGDTCSVTGAKHNNDGSYDVNYTYTTTGTDVKTAENKYYKNTVNGVTTYSTGLNSNTTTNLTEITSADTNYKTLQADLSTIYGDDYAKSGEKYYYTKSGDTYRFVTGAQLNSIQEGSSKTLQYSFIKEDTDITKSDTLKNAQVTWSDSGRMNTVTVTDKDGKEVTYTMTTNTKTDNDAYTDAYNEYQYKKAEYDQEMNKINAQICVIQNQDKKLELKLQDLDTNQQALSTEMESVKKVIDKNIESSFKAFSA